MKYFLSLIYEYEDFSQGIEWENRDSTKSISDSENAFT